MSENSSAHRAILDANFHVDSRYAESLTLSVKILTTLTAGAVGLLVPIIVANQTDTNLNDTIKVLHQSLISYTKTLAILVISAVLMVLERLVESRSLIYLRQSLSDSHISNKISRFSDWARFFCYTASFMQVLAVIWFVKASMYLAVNIR